MQWMLGVDAGYGYGFGSSFPLLIDKFGTPGAEVASARETDC